MRLSDSALLVGRLNCALSHSRSIKENVHKHEPLHELRNNTQEKRSRERRKRTEVLRRPRNNNNAFIYQKRTTIFFLRIAITSAIANVRVLLFIRPWCVKKKGFFFLGRDFLSFFLCCGEYGLPFVENGTRQTKEIYNPPKYEEGRKEKEDGGLLG